jgi:hypothetical protein
VGPGLWYVLVQLSIGLTSQKSDLDVGSRHPSQRLPRVNTLNGTNLLALSVVSSKGSSSSPSHQIVPYQLLPYHAPLFYKCLQHQGHKKDTRVTPGTFVMLGEGTKVDSILGMGPRALKILPIHGD